MKYCLLHVHSCYIKHCTITTVVHLHLAQLKVNKLFLYSNGLLRNTTIGSPELAYQ